MKTIIVWLRNDLRVHDHPALATALADADHIVPMFIFSDHLLKGRHSSSNRNRFLLECLADLKQSLLSLGGDLVIRSGDAATELQKLADEVNADAIYYSADYTPFAIKRDKHVKASLSDSLSFRSFPGRLAVSALDRLQTKSGTTHKVFTPFWRNWEQVQRRELAQLPTKVSLPEHIEIGGIPNLTGLTEARLLSPNTLRGGETAGRKRLQNFIKVGMADYHQTNNDMASEGTSRLSSYLHFGCLSPREVETMLPDNAGARAWHRQLAWREFYHYILYKFPANAQQEFQEKYRLLTWGNDVKLLQAWQDGRTGYPIVDAAMRQLLSEGWMHNRARLIVGSFLTKDLWLDWRHGEQHFMRWLIDGDEANNNGNWQWIASVGVDPAPVYRRLYNPSSQQKKFDPDGNYIRKYLPELAALPNKYLGEPWTMPADIQQKIGCVIGQDYPAPIVSHPEARRAALENYNSVR
jgi:deoxyribodipyrimidine photo-lyase